MSNSQGFGSPGVGQSPSEKKVKRVVCVFLIVECALHQWNLSLYEDTPELRKPLKITPSITTLNLSNQDTSLTMTLSSAPLVSGLEIREVPLHTLLGSYTQNNQKHTLTPLQTSGRSQELTPVTSAQIQSARENGDRFKINERDVSQVSLVM